MFRTDLGPGLRVRAQAPTATTAFSATSTGGMRTGAAMPEVVRLAVTAALDARRQALASEASNSASFSRIQAVS